MMRRMMAWCVLILLLCAGCCKQSYLEPRTWYADKEEAISRGLLTEGAAADNKLAIKEDQGDTLVFYTKHGALGVATLSVRDHTFSWYRNSPYMTAMPNDNPQAYGIWQLTSENGHVRTILFGKVFTSSSRLASLYDGGTLVDTNEIDASTGLFYFVISGRYSGGQDLLIEHSFMQ